MQTSLKSLVEAALAEDIDQGDITTKATVPAEARCRARLVAKQSGVLSGMDAFRTAFALLDADVTDWDAKSDGTRVEKGDILARFSGRTQSVLTAERTAMNFVQHLSGVATLTAQFVAALAGLECRICATRKTTPLLRQLEKDAVVHGGGATHRHNLFNGVLIKENHITAAGGLRAALGRVRHDVHHLHRIAVEAETLEQVDEALDAGADVILLDNMGLDTMREAVRRGKGQKVLFEASGNATLDRVRAMAETGVDYISVGAITHSAPVLDMSLLIENE